jgi:hypothetical protein
MNRVQDATPQQRFARYKAKKRASGHRRLELFVRDEIIEMLDQLIAANMAPSRSELLAPLLEDWMEAQKKKR